MSTQPPVTKADITHAVESLGLRTGDALLLHSALSSLGHVDGGADAVIDGILEVLGRDGHLMAPTFTFSPTTYFDVLHSPSKTGKITEQLRLRPAAVRSWSPTHAVSVIGPQADALIDGHIDRSPMAIDSPIDRLAKRGGWVLLLGVDHRANSTVHVGETYAGAPFLAAPRIPTAPAQAVVKLPNGSEVAVRHRQMPGCSAAFNAVELPLRRRHAIRDVRVGTAACLLMKGQDIIDATVALLHERMDLLLCANPACPVCAESRRRLEHR